MKRLEQEQRIGHLIAVFRAEVEHANAVNYTDINRVAEGAVGKLLQWAYGWAQLRNLNTETMNYPGVDLGDAEARVAVQVTSDPSSEKIKSTLATFREKGYAARYKRLVVFILGRRKNYTTDFATSTDKTFDFDKDRDILDIRGLVQRISSLDDDEVVEAILDYLEAQFSDGAEASREQRRLKAALRRLEALPLETIPDVNTAGTLTPSRLAYRPNATFTGREAEFRALATHLKAGRDVAVTGIGGSGKSQLVAEVAHRYGTFFEGGVFWLSFAQGAGVTKEVAECGAVMGFGPPFSELSLAARAAQVQAAWESPLPRLLIFDGCEDFELLKLVRPRAGGCRVLITSRRAEWPPEMNLHSVPLGVLNPEESRAMLLKYRPDLGDVDALATIAKTLGHLPLALHLAGSYLRRYKHAAFSQPGAYLEALKDSSLLDHPSLRGVSIEHSPTEHELNVSKTFALSYRRLSRFKPVDRLAREVLAHAANFAPGEVIPRRLLFATIEFVPHLLSYIRRQRGHAERVQQADDGPMKNLTAKQEDALARLVEVGLISRDAQGDISLHPLITAFALDQRSSAAAYEAVKVTLALEADRVVREKRPGNFLQGQTHLNYITDGALERYEIDAAYLSFVSGGILFDMALYHEAEAYLSRALELLEQRRITPLRSLFSLSSLTIGLKMWRPGFKMRLIAGCLNDLALSRTKLGRYSEAEVTHRRVLKLRLLSKGLRHPETAQSLNNLGDHYAQSEDYGKALTYHKRALAVRKALPNLSPVRLASSYHNIGFVYMQQEEHEKALSCYDRALTICRAELDSTHEFTAYTLQNMGTSLEALERRDKALECYDEALAMRREVLAEHHPRTKLSLESRDRVLEQLNEQRT